MSVTEPLAERRDEMAFDVVIVGAGPAGLSAAIRLKQNNSNLSVCIVEKGAEVGAHILSGAILDTDGLDRLIPDWRERNAPIRVQVKNDHWYFLSASRAWPIARFLLPKPMSNTGKWIVSIGLLCRWLAEQAQALGVEIYPSFAASSPVYNDDSALRGVVAGEFGLNKDGSPGPNYNPGVILSGKYLLIAEGARGSLAKELISRYELDRDVDFPKFALGMKELWELDDHQHKQGLAIHSVGWPLNSNADGGGFIYHLQNRQAYVGFVVHLDYRNPHLSPYMEFQRFKHHPKLAQMLQNGRRIAYGARVIAEGGWQSLPKMHFPGGILIGCAAGLVNTPRIKGNHNAMHSGILAADTISMAIAQGRMQDDLPEFADKFAKSVIARDLKPARNFKPLWSRFGILGAIAGLFDYWFAWLAGFNIFASIKHAKPDASNMDLAATSRKIAYPEPDSVLSFDRLTNVAFSGTSHAQEQPNHLRLRDPMLPVTDNLLKYAEPAQRYCPAAVYEIIFNQNNDPQFVINSQNCVHCKCCDIKDPAGNITWSMPQGGDGPNYTNM